MSLIDKIKGSKAQGESSQLLQKKREFTEVLTFNKSVPSRWRTALEATGLYLGYMAIGCLFYMHVETHACEKGLWSAETGEHRCPWSALDAIYFAHVTMSTVGYGDLFPSTTLSQVFTLFYIVVGVVVIFSRLAQLTTGFTQPLFEYCRARLDSAFPEDSVDLDGDGIADFKVPRHPLMYYGKALFAPVFLIVGVQLIFSAAFVVVQEEEHWTYWLAFYHCMITAFTVGYGDTDLHANDAGKICGIIQIMFTVCSLAALFGDFGKLQEQRKAQFRRAELLMAKLNPELITSLDRDGDGVDRLEFVVGMLVKLEVVQWADVEPFLTQFNLIDTDGSGHLTSADLVAYSNTLKETQPAPATRLKRSSTMPVKATADGLAAGAESLAVNVQRLKQEERKKASWWPC